MSTMSGLTLLAVVIRRFLRRPSSRVGSARSALHDLENVRQVMLELVELGERVCEIVLQVEVRLQLAGNVESRRVLEVCKLLPELFLSHLEVMQQLRDLLGIRELAGLHVADKPPHPIERPSERRFDIGSLEYAKCDLLKVFELRG